MEMVFWHAVVAPQMTFGLVPEILNSVDVIALVREQFGVVGPHMMEVRHIQGIVACKRARADQTVR